jgi:hypothetical protein
MPSSDGRSRSWSEIWVSTAGSAGWHTWPRSAATSGGVCRAQGTRPLLAAGVLNPDKIIGPRRPHAAAPVTTSGTDRLEVALARRWFRLLVRLVADDTDMVGLTVYAVGALEERVE